MPYDGTVLLFMSAHRRCTDKAHILPRALLGGDQIFI